MPITESGTVNYKLPEKYNEMMDYTFCKTMMQSIHNIWGISAEDYDYESISFCEGTGGWNEAFLTSCRLLKKDELAKYYQTLPYYDSDIFDGYLSQKFVDYKLLLPKDESDEIARQLNIESDKIKVCEECGEYFLEEDVEIVNENEDEDFESSYICKKCLEKDNVKSLVYNKNKTLVEILELKASDYFVCSDCGKIHFIYNKGENDKCKYCEYQEISDNKNANAYYQESIILNEKYLRTFLPKILEYNEYEGEIKYDSKKDIFYGQIVKYKEQEVKDKITFSNKNYYNIRKEFENAVKTYIEMKKVIGN